MSMCSKQKTAYEIEYGRVGPEMGIRDRSQTAIIAGTMGAKRTSELIPFCHPIGLDSCRIGIALDENGDVVIDCTTRVEHRTGIEMEALTGASIAALKGYDSGKALSLSLIHF